MWVEFLQCNLITVFGVLGAFFLLKGVRLGNIPRKIISMLGPVVILVYIIHEVFLPYFIHKDTIFPFIWLLAFWSFCFVISYLLNKLPIVSNFLKI